MNKFKTIVQFTEDKQNRYEGSIILFDGENKIQDDKIIDIKLLESRISFYIAAKETVFEGELNNQLTELSGDFIFPDGTRHAIQLIKSMDDNYSKEAFYELKNQRYSIEELQADLSLLYLNLTKYHPQLYTYTSKDSMDMLLEKLKADIDTSLTREEFYIRISELTDAVHCSHTGLKLPTDYLKLVNKYGNFFPWRLFFENGKAFYVSGRVKVGDSPRPGEQILSINNTSIDKIITQIFKYIPSEAHNSTTKYHVLNRRFNELFYFLVDSEEFTVTFRSLDSIKTLKLPAVRLKDFHLDFITSMKKMEFKYLGQHETGLLTIPTFGIQNMDHFFSRLDSVFTDLKSKNAQNLILDLRDNAGGHPIFAAQLFSYLTDKEFIYFKRNEEVEEFEPLYGEMHPNKLNFNGNLYVLIDGGCLSTTGHLISLLKVNTDAVFIGEEPGSAFRCNDFSFQLNLTHTGVEVNIPRTTFETTATGIGVEKLLPEEFRVEVTIDDVIKDKDVIFEKAILIISQ